MQPGRSRAEPHTELSVPYFLISAQAEPNTRTRIRGAISRIQTAEPSIRTKIRKRTEQSFFVPKEEIAANGYDLSINKYKETEYVPVEYPSTQEILADLHELEMEITKGLAELEEMV